MTSWGCLPSTRPARIGKSQSTRLSTCCWTRLTADRLGGTEDLLDGARELLGKRLVAQLAGNLDNVVNGNVAGVNTAFLLFAVSRRLLEGADDERRCRGNDGDSGLTVLDGELDGHTKTLPVAGGLGDVFTDLFGRLFAKGAQRQQLQPEISLRL